MLPKSAYIKTIIVLFIIALLLLISHLIISALLPETKSKFITTLTDEEIEAQFIESLQSFALKNEWIRKLSTDKQISTYQIKVPSDLPISYIIFDLNQRFFPHDILVRGEEKKINERTVVSIICDEKKIINADFVSDPNIKRQESVTSLFIYGRENNELEYDSLFRYLTREYSALLIPSKSSAMFGKWLKENGFDYAVLINDKVTELDYRLAKGFSEARIGMVVRNLVGGFPNALFFMVDENSEIYSPEIFQLLKLEFDKRRIKLLPSSYLVFIDNSLPNFAEKFSESVRGYISEGKNRIAISYDAFTLLNQEMNKLIRIGYKFEKLKRE